MKYLFINSVSDVRSTGKLIVEQCRKLQKEGHTCVIAFARESAELTDIQTIRIGGKKDYLVHALISRVFDCQGFLSKHATKIFLKKVEEYAPDVIWLHNLHGYYINVELLFTWIKAHPSVKVYWTFHDCWPFTGHCTNFTVAHCEKWKTCCENCSQKTEYPKCFLFDRSRENYLRKKKAFTGVHDLTVVVPSNWLAGLVSQSFLRDYPIDVCPNIIDTNIFHPKPSDFRRKNGLENKYIVLGVAAKWESTKGMQDMLELRKYLDDDFEIVMVGVTSRQIASLPSGFLGIPRTKNQTELAEIYTAAEVFVNPTHQDNFPTVNLEARACGTPVVTYNVGGSPESAGGKYIVEEGDIAGMAEKIYELTRQRRKR